MAEAGLRRGWLWLVAAAVLLLAAGILMGREGPEAKEDDEAPQVNYPARLREPERQRLAARRALAARLLKAADDAGFTMHKTRDPVLSALPPKGSGKSAMVIEANAIRNSPLGEALIDCFRKSPKDPIQAFQSKTGVDPLKDIDRVVAMSDGFMMSGNFQGARWSSVFAGPSNATAYGDHGNIYPEASGRALGVWGDQMVMEGASVAEVQAIIDRVEGRAPDEAPMLSDDQAYGEIYGTVAPSDLSKMLGDTSIAQQIQALAPNVTVHADTSGDVAMVADVAASDTQALGDLGKSTGALLSVARLQAQAEDPTFAQLLEQAKVVPGSDSFRVEVALPLPFLQKALSHCHDGAPGRDGG